MRTLITPLFGLLAAQLVAQDIVFYPSPEEAMARYETEGQGQFGKCENVTQIDSSFYYNVPVDKLEIVTEQRGPARYEYYADGQLYRGIEIRQEERTDTLMVEDLGTKAMTMVVETVEHDVPDGLYLEMHPNGKIRVQGTLAGFDENGVPLKKGEWQSFDETGTRTSVMVYE